MARTGTRAATASRQQLHQSNKNVKRTANTQAEIKEAKKRLSEDVAILQEKTPPKSSGRKRVSSAADLKPAKKVKREEATALPSPSPSTSTSPPPSSSKKSKKKADSADLQAKKLKKFELYANVSPFPDFPHPTPDECRLAHKILASIHGPRVRPAEIVASKTRAGCGDSPSVLDALVRTILSQNTSDANSTRAKLSMDEAYGGSDNWEKIVEGGVGKLQEAIKCGGLSAVKSKVIMSILQQAKEKYGQYSLDHLHDASTEDAYKEMVSFQGVGPKTASCVLLFCLKRESFAVDTHVFRISGLLGWVPKNADRETTQAHLDVRVPDEVKYGLHILMVTHGKRCDECRAGGKNAGKCELRKAFRKEKVKEEMKAEDDLDIKEEDH